MKGKTGELLYFLLWFADRLARPTFRNLTDSFEGWSYQNGLSLQLARLEKMKLVERNASNHSSRLYRLTEAGRIQALGGRDPVARWSRPWDGKWRLFLFDVPVVRNSHRDRLRYLLKNLCFGVLQGSVWISPDPPGTELEILKQGKTDVNSLLVLEARPGSGEKDAEIVAGAWDFEEIHSRYTNYLKLLDQRPPGRIAGEAEARSFREWAELERDSWREIVRTDPFLPRVLLPKDYLGCRAWRRRISVLREAKQQLLTFISNTDSNSIRRCEID